MTDRPGTSQPMSSKAKNPYECLREPEEQHKDDMNERLIAKLGEVRYLVSQIVLEEEEEEIKNSFVEGRQDSIKSQVDNKAGPFLKIL